MSFTYYIAVSLSICWIQADIDHRPTAVAQCADSTAAQYADSTVVEDHSSNRILVASGTFEENGIPKINSVHQNVGAILRAHGFDSSSDTKSDTETFNSVLRAIVLSMQRGVLKLIGAS